ncbi:hypothetical protein BO71DRAFT_400021, partial [Aspergillus ellipticus CBS 707.79]
MFKGGENCLKDYPNNIKGCFRLIILDKAYNLRNKTSGISQAVIGPAAVKKALTTSPGTRYVNLILSKVFLERTLASAIPFKSSQIISKDIPPAVHQKSPCY